jgi:hypothetical protein
MPSIDTASVPVTEFPNLFVSPYGNDGIVPLYSSVPIKNTIAGCIPCVVCGNTLQRKQIITQASSAGSHVGTGATGLVTTPNQVPYSKIVSSSAPYIPHDNGDGSVVGTGSWNSTLYYRNVNGVDTLVGATGNMLVSVPVNITNNSVWSTITGNASITGSLDSGLKWNTYVSQNLQNNGFKGNNPTTFISSYGQYSYINRDAGSNTVSTASDNYIADAFSSNGAPQSYESTPFSNSNSFNRQQYGAGSIYGFYIVQGTITTNTVYPS